MLITFEGGECSGKNTQVAMLAKRLERDGYTVKADLWEPGSTPKAELIRLILKNQFNSDFEFPGDFKKTFDLVKHRDYFAEDKLPATAKKYLEQASKNLNGGLKQEAIHYVIHDDFVKHGNLEHTINYLNNEGRNTKIEGRAATPADLLLRNFFSEEKLLPLTQLYLYMAARNILYETVIKEAVNHYDFVIINRSLDSSKVYQGHAQDPSLNNLIDELNKEATCGIIPDLTLFLDIPVSKIGERKANRDNANQDNAISQNTLDFYDTKDDPFHTKVRNGYLAEVLRCGSLPAWDKEYGRIVRIKAMGTKFEVNENIYGEILNKINP
jgi:thymidylate kinase